MTTQATEIEVEVVEIDGLAPTERQAPAEELPPQNDWRQWQGRVLTLGSRWWPLWVFLGIIALALMLTVGLVIAVFFVIVRVCLKLIRAIIR